MVLQKCASRRITRSLKNHVRHIGAPVDASGAQKSIQKRKRRWQSRQGSDVVKNIFADRGSCMVSIQLTQRTALLIIPKDYMWVLLILQTLVNQVQRHIGIVPDHFIGTHSAILFPQSTHLQYHAKVPASFWARCSMAFHIHNTTKWLFDGFAKSACRQTGL